MKLILNTEQLKAAREWLIDCYPNQEDEINHANAETIERAIRLNFDGGMDAFLKSFN